MAALMSTGAQGLGSAKNPEPTASDGGELSSEDQLFAAFGESGESLMRYGLGMSEDEAIFRLREDVATPLHEIVPGEIYLGNEVAARHLQGLLAANVRFIVNCLDESYCFHRSYIDPETQKPRFRYLTLSMDDDEQEDAFARFSAVTNFIEEALIVSHASTIADTPPTPPPPLPSATTESSRQDPMEEAKEAKRLAVLADLMGSVAGLAKPLSGGTIFVHCSVGVSRSVTVLCAFLMSHYRISARQALQKVQLIRSCADPNKRFREDVLKWQSYLRIPRVPEEALLPRTSSSSKMWAAAKRLQRQSDGGSMLEGEDYVLVSSAGGGSRSSTPSSSKAGAGGGATTLTRRMSIPSPLWKHKTAGGDESGGEDLAAKQSVLSLPSFYGGAGAGLTTTTHHHHQQHHHSSHHPQGHPLLPPGLKAAGSSLYIGLPKHPKKGTARDRSGSIDNSKRRAAASADGDGDDEADAFASAIAVTTGSVPAAAPAPVASSSSSSLSVPSAQLPLPVPLKDSAPSSSRLHARVFGGVSGAVCAIDENSAILEEEELEGSPISVSKSSVNLKAPAGMAPVLTPDPVTSFLVRSASINSMAASSSSVEGSPMNRRPETGSPFAVPPPASLAAAAGLTLSGTGNENGTGTGTSDGSASGSSVSSGGGRGPAVADFRIGFLPFPGPSPSNSAGSSSSSSSSSSGLTSSSVGSHSHGAVFGSGPFGGGGGSELSPINGAGADISPVAGRGLGLTNLTAAAYRTAAAAAAAAAPLAGSLISTAASSPTSSSSLLPPTTWAIQPASLPALSAAPSPALARQPTEQSSVGGSPPSGSSPLPPTAAAASLSLSEYEARVRARIMSETAALRGGAATPPSATGAGGRSVPASFGTAGTTTDTTATGTPTAAAAAAGESPPLSSGGNFFRKRRGGPVTENDWASLHSKMALVSSSSSAPVAASFSYINTGNGPAPSSGSAGPAAAPTPGADLGSPLQGNDSAVGMGSPVSRFTKSAAAAAAAAAVAASLPGAPPSTPHSQCIALTAGGSGHQCLKPNAVHSPLCWQHEKMVVEGLDVSTIHGLISPSSASPSSSSPTKAGAAVGDAGKGRRHRTPSPVPFPCSGASSSDAASLLSPRASANRKKGGSSIWAVDDQGAQEKGKGKAGPAEGKEAVDSL